MGYHDTIGPGHGVVRVEDILRQGEWSNSDRPKA